MATITAAPVPLSLQNGESVKEFRLHPFTDRDMDELHEWVRSKYIRQAELASRDLPDESRQMMLGTAMDKASSLRWTSGVGAQLIGTEEGLARILWQGIRRDHKDTVDELRSLLNSAENVEAFSEALGRANGGKVTAEPNKKRDDDGLTESRKIKLYASLSKMYGWTPQQIADMTPHQQLDYANAWQGQYGDLREFKSLDELNEWRARHGS